ncbi:hypothetical protein CC86DRAFT_375389 [Ophiobolus disseminans]|uniref:Uncharacterized protein n=1 Tax=Ophiobolus disseminans TaxID=1469910 RepID=A0A6A6ZD85_9PLEO|nr:hypothetical protein CC86DRAFT_375389 [Ophiobolus disseminans]
MPYHHNTSLSLNLRFRSHSDPTPRSFTVDRTSTKHNIFTLTMDQLDGASDSKPSKSDASSASSAPARCNSARKSFKHMFGGKKERKPSVVSIAPTETTQDDVTLQVISPRVTTAEPKTPKARQRTFSFKKRRSSAKSKNIPSPDLTTQRNSLVASASTPASAISLAEALDRTEGHLPVTDAPYQSPGREAALTSHPIVAVDTESEESADRFETPTSELVRQGTGFFGQK